MYTHVGILLPTRKRVANGKLPRFADSAISMASDGGERLRWAFLYDGDDEETKKYLHTRYWSPSLTMCVNKENHEPHLAVFFNRLYRATRDWGKETLVSMLGDDMEFLTKDWDKLILEKANETKGRCVIYGDDCFVQHAKMTVHFFTSRLIVEATGMPFMWERWRSNIIDYVWTRVGQELGILCYIPELHIKHHHASAAGIDGDETYHRMDSSRCFAAGRGKLIEGYVKQIVDNVKKSGVLC